MLGGHFLLTNFSDASLAGLEAHGVDFNSAKFTNANASGVVIRINLSAPTPRATTKAPTWFTNLAGGQFDKASFHGVSWC